MSLPSCPGAGYELIEGHRCVSTAGFVEPFNFAAVGARQPTSPARVLEDAMGRAARLPTKESRVKVAGRKPADQRLLHSKDRFSTGRRKGEGAPKPDRASRRARGRQDRFAPDGWPCGQS